MPRWPNTSLACWILRQTSGRPRFCSCFATSCQSIDINTLLRPSRADSRMLLSVQNQRFATHKKEVTDVVLHRDVDGVFALLERDAAALLGIEPVHREAAKIALGIANIGDGELEIARASMIEHFADQSEDTFVRPVD